MANTIRRRRAIKNMAMMAGAINRMGDGTYTCQIPFGSIGDISTVDIERISKKWLKKVKPKKRMTKKEYRRWKNKMKRLGVA